MRERTWSAHESRLLRANGLGLRANRGLLRANGPGLRANQGLLRAIIEELAPYSIL
ncbi:hypothetical protein [Fictibacillus macauensis]|uniref:hypothetical protein n=1 Tax=Fictibacillus macauensis TaxID=245160 RepID=UPI0002E01C42|nr:hypothetical protein [Fictibacillus macauensis]